MGKGMGLQLGSLIQPGPVQCHAAAGTCHLHFWHPCLQNRRTVFVFGLLNGQKAWQKAGGTPESVSPRCHAAVFAFSGVLRITRLCAEPSVTLGRVRLYQGGVTSYPGALVSASLIVVFLNAVRAGVLMCLLLELPFHETSRVSG